MEKTKTEPLKLLKGCSTFINNILIRGVNRQSSNGHWQGVSAKNKAIKIRLNYLIFQTLLRKVEISSTCSRLIAGITGT